MGARRRGREVGLERVLGAPAFFATAYGNVGSAIYYALGLTGVYAAGLTLIAVLVALNSVAVSEATQLPVTLAAVDFATRVLPVLSGFVLVVNSDGLRSLRDPRIRRARGASARARHAS